MSTLNKQTVGARSRLHPSIIAVFYLSFAVGIGAGVLWIWGALHRRWDPVLAFAAVLGGSVVLYASMHR